jgi:hypothetical protein
MIQPLRVVDDARQGPVSRYLGEQAEDRQPDQEPIRWAAAPAKPDGRTQRLLLRTGQGLKPVQYWRAELMQSGERQLHLGLDARGPDHSAAGRPVEDNIQQDGLADARFAP